MGDDIGESEELHLYLEFARTLLPDNTYSGQYSNVPCLRDGCVKVRIVQNFSPPDAIFPMSWAEHQQERSSRGRGETFQDPIVNLSNSQVSSFLYAGSCKSTVHDTVELEPPTWQQDGEAWFDPRTRTKDA